MKDIPPYFLVIKFFVNGQFLKIFGRFLQNSAETIRLRKFPHQEIRSKSFHFKRQLFFPFISNISSFQILHRPAPSAANLDCLEKAKYFRTESYSWGGLEKLHFSETWKASAYKRPGRAWSLQERKPEQILSQSYDLSVKYL